MIAIRAGPFFLCFDCLNDENSLVSDDEVKIMAVYRTLMTGDKREEASTLIIHLGTASDTGWISHVTVLGKKVKPPLWESLFKNQIWCL